MINSQRVVVVDDVPDTGEVLKAVLEPRGWRVDRVRRLDQVRSRIAVDRPTLMIVDADASTAAADTDRDLTDVPRVIIGSLPARTGSEPADASPRSYLSKPFQYAELLQAIDALLTDAPGS